MLVKKWGASPLEELKSFNDSVLKTVLHTYYVPGHNYETDTFCVLEKAVF